jgi:hypothetical protein
MASMLPESVKFYVVHHEPSDSWQLCLRSGMPCMARRPLATVIEVCGRTERARPSKGFAWPLNVMHVTDDDLPGEWRGLLFADGMWADDCGQCIRDLRVS